MNVSQLYIYPVKSLGGIALNTVTVTDRGFEYDRRWMLVDENNRFVSQREVAEMALLTLIKAVRRQPDQRRAKVPRTACQGRINRRRQAVFFIGLCLFVTVAIAVWHLPSITPTK